MRGVAENAALLQQIVFMRETSSPSLST